MYFTERLAEAVGHLSASIGDASTRAQLHALAGIVRNLDPPANDAALRAELVGAVDAALETGDGPALIAAMRALAAFDRQAIRPIDWSAASGG